VVIPARVGLAGGEHVEVGGGVDDGDDELLEQIVSPRPGSRVLRQPGMAISTGENSVISSSSEQGSISVLTSRDSLAGTWEGAYSEDGGEERFRLRINTRTFAELLDEGVTMELVEFFIKDSLATVHAGWTDDAGQRREAFFTGPIRAGIWQGKVTMTSGADVLLQGDFNLKK
jgi:hypothetical protein